MSLAEKNNFKTYYDSASDLTEKEESFCQSYVFVTDCDERMAYEMAGYSMEAPKNIRIYVHNLMKRKQIKNRIDELMTEKQKMASVDVFWVTEKLRRIVLDNVGKPQIQLKALELLGKALGMFTDVQVLKGSEDDPGELAQRAFEENRKQMKLLDLKKQIIEGDNNKGSQNGNNAETPVSGANVA